MALNWVLSGVLGLWHPCVTHSLCWRTLHLTAHKDPTSPPALRASLAGVSGWWLHCADWQRPAGLAAQEKGKLSQQEKWAFIFTSSFHLQLSPPPPNFKQSPQKMAVLRPSHPKGPSFSKTIPPSSSGIGLSFNPTLTLDCLMTLACYPSLK